MSAANAAAGHVPVLRDRVLALLGPALELEGAVLVDATLGRAGHARALLAAHPGLSLVGIDADETAIDESRWSGRSTTSCPTSWPGSACAASRASCSTSGSPPRSWTIRSAASPTPMTRRWTCAWTPRASSRRPRW